MTIVAFAGWASDALVKGTLIFVVAAIATRLLRDRSAADRHRVWHLAIVALLALPLLGVILPSVRLPLLPALDRPTTVETADREAAQRRSSGVDVGASRGVTELKTEGGTPDAIWAHAILRSLATLAGTGTVLLLGFLAVGILHTRRLAQESHGRPAGWSAQRVSRLAARLGCQRPVRVRLTPRVTTPIAFGWRQPTVLLPANSRGWSEEDLHATLVHELAHIARGDWFRLITARLAVALFWFHPLLWLALRRHQDEAEHACDERVLAAGVEAAAYARHLLAVACRARRIRPAIATAMARPMARNRSALSRRIRAILEHTNRRPPLNRHQVLAFTTLTLILTLTLAPARLVRAEADPDPRDERTLLVDEIVDALRILLDDDDIDAPLIAAANAGNGGLVELLLENGADPDRIMHGDGSPLIAAITAGSEPVIELLLDAGADPNLGVAGDGSPLIAAAMVGDLDLVDRLIDLGADPNQGIPGDGSPLIAAAGVGNNDVVERLLERGADLELQVEGDENALIKAAEQGQLKTVEFLLDLGAEPNVAIPIEAWSGRDEVRTAISQANRGGHSAIVELLRARGARE